VTGAPLYLHLISSGGGLALIPDPEATQRYRLRATWRGDLPLGEYRRTRALIAEHKDTLLALMISGAPDALAIVREGGYVLSSASPTSRRPMERGDA
jgi:hypothetical protein